MDTVYSLHFPAVVFWQLAMSKSHCSRGLHESPRRAYSICKLNYFAVVQIKRNPVNAKNPSLGAANTLEQMCDFRHISCLHKMTLAEGSAYVGVHCCSAPCSVGSSDCCYQKGRNIDLLGGDNWPFPANFLLSLRGISQWLLAIRRVASRDICMTSWELDLWPASQSPSLKL